jgi:hypothetical protein
MFRCPHIRGRFHRTLRDGTTVVETAFVLPVFLTLVLALIELGHAQMVQNVLRSACRSGARLGSTEGQTTSNVEAHVRQILSGAMDEHLVHVFVKDASALDSGGEVPESGAEVEAMPAASLEDMEPRSLFLVRARVNYNQIALVPMPFAENVVLEGQAIMRHE